MYSVSRSASERILRILTTNWHVPYVYLLAHTGHEFDVVDSWNESQRPLPSNVRVISQAEALHNLGERRYDAVIGHKPFTDLRTFGITAFRKRIPYIQILHGRLERTGYKRSSLRRFAKRIYKDIVLVPLSWSQHITFVFISPTVASSWKLKGTVITPGIPIKQMGIWRGDSQELLVVGNYLHREHFDYKVLLKLAEMPIRIIGENPQLPNVKPAVSFEELKQHYKTCRAFVNLTKEPEDGYNLATLEAMATGMPVLTLTHPNSPINDCYNGMVAQDFQDLLKKGTTLLKDWKLAKRLGDNAKKTVEMQFNIEIFCKKWGDLLGMHLKGFLNAIHKVR